MSAPALSLPGALWRGAVVGGLVLVAQVAFALPAALAGENTAAGRRWRCSPCSWACRSAACCSAGWRRGCSG